MRWPLLHLALVLLVGGFFLVVLTRALDQRLDEIDHAAQVRR